jgi:hypothetical protein
MATMRSAASSFSGILLGLLAGALFWSLLLGIQVRRHEPGLWTVRIQRIVACGLDYNGPPFTHGDRSLWLTCGQQDSGWQLWPLP